MPLYTTAAPATKTGTVADFAGSAAPTGWLLCDGSAVSRTTYADLFAEIGTTYGVGDGSTTFNLPDAQGRMTVGLGTNADVNALGDSDGLAIASRTPKHTHGPGTLGGTTGTPSANQSAATPLLGAVPSLTHTHNFSVTTGSSASAGPGFITMNKIIKT